MPAPLADSDHDDNVLARAVDVDSLYRRYGRRSFAFLASMGVRGSDADDVQQIAWMRVLESLRKQPFEGHFRAWLFQILRNAAIDMMKKRRPDSIDHALADQTAASIPPPDQTLIDEEYRSELESCLQRLDEASRMIVRKRLAGLGYDSIATEMSISTARAHRMFFSAKESLTQCLSSGYNKVNP
ncbi:sigma-70 family RNA polymerase sigma factor [Rubripirellula tenax]|nr:sigma-70 family RNA polymerase sigma factor [Rubripirellula tenax]